MKNKKISSVLAIAGILAGGVGLTAYAQSATVTTSIAKQEVSDTDNVQDRGRLGVRSQIENDGEQNEEAEKEDLQTNDEDDAHENDNQNENDTEIED